MSYPSQLFRVGYGWAISWMRPLLKDKIEKPGLNLQEQIKDPKHSASILLLFLHFSPLLSPVLAHLVWFQFAVYIHLLIYNYDSMKLFLLVSIVHPWILLHIFSLGQFLIARSLLALILLLPRLPLCALSEFPALCPLPLSLVLFLLETSLAWQIMSPLLSFLFMLLIFLPFHSLDCLLLPRSFTFVSSVFFSWFPSVLLNALPFWHVERNWPLLLSCN